MTAQEVVKGWAREIVQQSSGGIKFIELMTKLMTRAMDRKEDFGTVLKRVTDGEWVEQTIEEMDDIKILRYSWQLSGELSREKLFIYTP